MAFLKLSEVKKSSRFSSKATILESFTFCFGHEQLNIKEGKIKLKDLGEGTETIALHDSCYLGRYHDIYDAPRNIVNAVPDAQLIELPRNKSRSVCCGAGGGRFWMEEDIGERINVHRSKEIAEMNTKSVGANCPFCLTMISDGMKDEAVGKGDVPVRDLAEIVAARLDV